MDATALHSLIQEPEMAKLALRRDELALFRRIKGDSLKSDAQFAAAIGVHKAQVSRVLAGKSAPGMSFVVGCCKLFGGLEVLPKLFVIDDNGDNGNGVAA